MQIETLDPSKDAYVEEDNPNTNYGTLTYLTLLDSTNTKEGYMEFILPLKVIDNASLIFYAYDSYQTPIDLYIRRSTIGWEETSITWNNKPGAYGDTVIYEVNGDGWHTVDITSIVEGASDSISLHLKIKPTTQVEYFSIYSRESSSLTPYLTYRSKKDIEKEISTNNKVYPVQGVTLTLVELYDDPMQEHTLSFVSKFFSWKNVDPEFTLNPVAVPHDYNGGFNSTGLIYSYWKHILPKVTTGSGNIRTIGIYSEDSGIWTGEKRLRLIVGNKGSIPHGCPLSSYDPCNGNEFTGYPIWSTISGSLGHEYYRNEITPYSTFSGYTEDSLYVVSTLGTDSLCLVIQLQTGFETPTSSKSGTILTHDYWRPYSKIIKWKIYQDIDGHLFEYYFDHTIKVDIIGFTIPLRRIDATINMIAIEGEVKKGTISAWDNSLMTTAENIFFTGTDYFGNNSMLRICKTAHNVSISSSEGSYPSGWLEDGPSSTQFQIKGYDHYLEFSSIDINKQDRFAIRFMIPYDVTPGLKSSIYITAEGDRDEDTIYWNIGTDTTPLWIPSNIIYVGSSLSGYKRQVFYKPRDIQVVVPFQTFDITNKIWVRYSRDVIPEEG